MILLVLVFISIQIGLAESASGKLGTNSHLFGLRTSPKADVQPNFEQIDVLYGGFPFELQEKQRHFDRNRNPVHSRFGREEALSLTIGVNDRNRFRPTVPKLEDLQPLSLDGKTIQGINSAFGIPIWRSYIPFRGIDSSGIQPFTRK